MNLKFKFLLILLIPLLAFSAIHKYFVSVTQVEYVQNKQSVQIISRIFTDDFEKILRDKYDASLTLDNNANEGNNDVFISKYLKEKLKFKVNGKEATVNFIGKEYDTDLVKCYLEIEGVKKIESLEISNQVLFDLYSEQQNIVKTKIYAQQKSFLLHINNKSALLNFN